MTGVGGGHKGLVELKLSSQKPGEPLGGILGKEVTGSDLSKNKSRMSVPNTS